MFPRKVPGLGLLVPGLVGQPNQDLNPTTKWARYQGKPSEERLLLRFQNEALAHPTHEPPGFPQWLLFLPPCLLERGECLAFSPPLSRPSILSW